MFDLARDAARDIRAAIMATGAFLFLYLPARYKVIHKALRIERERASELGTAARNLFHLSVHLANGEHRDEAFAIFKQAERLFALREEYLGTVPREVFLSERTSCAVEECERITRAAQDSVRGRGVSHG